MILFMIEDFLLDIEFVCCLYYDYVKDQLIFDYYCYLLLQQIVEDYCFKNLYDIWLKGDYYKWCVMCINGVVECLCIGDVFDCEKFDVWVVIVLYIIGNLLYYWMYFELCCLFGIIGKLFFLLIVDEIWNECNELLVQDNFFVCGIMQQMNVKMVGIIDDLIDFLEYYVEIVKDGFFIIKVLLSWCLDKVFNIEQVIFNDYMVKLGEVFDIDICCFVDL